MKLPYKIIIKNINTYKEFEISEYVSRVSLGTKPGCELRLNRNDYFDEIEITFINKDDEWQVICNDAIFLSLGDVRKITFSKIKHGNTFSVKYASNGANVFQLSFSVNFEAKIPPFNRYVDINDETCVSIGSNSASHFYLKGDFTDDALIYLKKDGTEFFVEEEKSQYGVYVNGKKIDGKIQLKNHDFLSISDVFFYYNDKKVYFNKDKVKVKVFVDRESESESVFSYPVFVRNSRRKMKVIKTPIHILDPGKIPTKPEVNLVTSLIPAIIMFVLVVVLRGIMATTMGSYIIFSICSMGLGVFTSVASIIQGKKKYKNEIKNRSDVYNKYIENKEVEIWKARENEIEILNEIYYSPTKGIEKVLNFESDIFDRIPLDNDFLDIYLGIGKRVSARQIEYKSQEKLEADDELAAIPEQIHKKYIYIDNAPIVASIRKAGAVGVVGGSYQCYQMFKNIFADIVCRQFYSEVSFYLLIDSVEKYEWTKRLPQLQKGSGSRNIVFDNNSKNNIFEDLFKELTFRSENKGLYKHIVVFVMNDFDITNHPISKFISQAAELQTTFIFFERSVDFLPLYCSSIVELKDGNRGVYYATEDRINTSSFTYENIPDTKMVDLVNKVAPVYSEEISLASTLRKNISLYEMLGIYTTSDIDLGKQWDSAKIYESMAAPLGINAKNEIVYLDLHEKAHGPHGLVAGTTGSGKSEILQSYILSAALNFHPYEIGFVIIDFKGGGMANQFKKLPHLIGTITNIDGKEINRSLKSIKAELLRRQELFKKANVNQIDKYIVLFKENKVKDPLPHLVIIVDEFAELKAVHPEFMKELISAARIGRSLGVHLILATQKPAGQVNEQIWSNSKFKLCLKVQDQQDSKEVIKSPLAAEIKEPGRAYLQVGNNEIFELFQSAYSGGPSIREDDSAQKKFSIYKYSISGRSSVLFEQKVKKKQNTTESELEALVNYIAKYCETKGIERLPSICLPPLKDVYEFKNEVLDNQCMSVPSGIYDNPDLQYQGVYVSNIGNENTIVIGGSQMGKTNFLQLCIRYLATNNSPEDVNFYVLDFGSMILKTFDNLSHVGGVVLPSEDEKLKNLFKLVSYEMDIRKSKMLNAGVSSFQSYIESGYKDLPKIYIFIDNFNAFKELYMDKYEQIFVRICRDGISLGISIIITNMSTAGIGYRYLSNFSNRICFTCNEKSDYSSLLSRCRIEPRPVPGRILFEKDKEIYEAQVYQAFEGKKEGDRANSIKIFINNMNLLYEEFKSAKQIPCIPDILRWKQFNSLYRNLLEENEIPLGLNFSTIEPVSIDLMDDFEFAIIAKKRNKIQCFLRSFIRCMQFLGSNSEIQYFVLDGIERELKEFKNSPFMNHYSIDMSDSEIILDRVLENLKQNKENLLSEGGRKDLIANIVVLNSKQTIEYISSTKAVLEKFKNIASNYANYGVLFIYGAVENAMVTYSGPELLKRIKDNKKVVLLDDIKTLKIFDISVTQVREFSKEVRSDEGFWINGTDIQKIKLFSEVE